MSQPSNPPCNNNVNFLAWIWKYGFAGVSGSDWNEATPQSNAGVPEVVPYAIFTTVAPESMWNPLVTVFQGNASPSTHKSRGFCLPLYSKNNGS